MFESNEKEENLDNFAIDNSEIIKRKKHKRIFLIISLIIILLIITIIIIAVSRKNNKTNPEPEKNNPEPEKKIHKKYQIIISILKIMKEY